MAQFVLTKDGKLKNLDQLRTMEFLVIGSDAMVKAIWMDTGEEILARAQLPAGVTAPLTKIQEAIQKNVVEGIGKNQALDVSKVLEQTVKGFDPAAPKPKTKSYRSKRGGQI